ncbi:hypothetical protein L873DRAFT_1802210 [Choiromyces venosus 120613-1]|uniref:DUF7896 domain-containing protein n=1 Tax=Choiromyces venosus 120613-1 TaxID=1336337 RepID=A0A3N4K1J1_9PEZI|nr:hypothetical protein L873DRAFT_1802210 [Choiromyces venosus 120613-1]
MAAPPLGIPREEGVPPNNLKSYLLDFTKFQLEHPGLSPDECAHLFYGEVTAGQSAAPVQGESVSSDLRTVNHKADSCPGGSQSPAPPLESQRMCHSNSTSSYLGAAPTAQQTFALMSGRSPHQFQVSNSVTCRQGYHENTLPQKNPQITSLEDLQSMVCNGNLAIADYLSQQDSSEPFPLLRHSVGTTGAAFCDDSIDKDCSFGLDGSSGIYAPRMQPQLSSSTSGCYTGGDESYLDSPGSLSHPMTRHSRSYSNASYKSRSSYFSSQGESTSPTDRFPYMQNSGAPMSRETSNASLAHGTMMLRVSSSTGNSTSGNGGGDYDSLCGQGDMDTMLNGVGFFASDAGLSSSFDKATGQHMLKRASSTSVEDLDHSLAIAVEHEMRRDPSTASESVKSRKPKRVREEAEPTVAVQSEGVSTTVATRRETPEKEKPEHQAQRGGDSGSPAAIDEAAQHESSDRVATTGNLPAGGRVLAASKPDKSGPKYATVSATKSSYIRPPHPRVHCKQCNENPDGFRGDHELRRHTEREHAPTRKMFVIKDISKSGQFLAKCKACQSGKRYGVDYNAAAHLRRQHFNANAKKDDKKKRMSFNTSYPNMADLRKWIEEVEVVVEPGEYSPEELQGTEISNANNAQKSVNTESTSVGEGEREQGVSQISDPENAAAEISAASVVIQDGALGVPDIPIQQQHQQQQQQQQEVPFNSIVWDQSGNWCASNDTYDLSHNYGVQCSVTGGSIPLADALNCQNNAAAGQNGMMVPQQQVWMQLFGDGPAAPPLEGGETASTIFGSLPGPAAY